MIHPECPVNLFLFDMSMATPITIYKELYDTGWKSLLILRALRIIPIHDLNSAHSTVDCDMSRQ